MTNDGMKIIDAGKTVFAGNAHQPTIEGPKLYKRNGYYYTATARRLIPLASDSERAQENGSELRSDCFVWEIEIGLLVMLSSIGSGSSDSAFYD